MLHASCIVAEIGGDRCFLAEKNGDEAALILNRDYTSCQFS
jgi:hypothetical protein